MHDKPLGQRMRLHGAIVRRHDSNLAPAGPLRHGEARAWLPSVEFVVVFVPHLDPARPKQQGIARLDRDAFRFGHRLDFFRCDDVAGIEHLDTVMTGDVDQDSTRDNAADVADSVLASAGRVDRVLRRVPVVHLSVRENVAERVDMRRAVRMDHQDVLSAAGAIAVNVTEHRHVPILVARRPNGSLGLEQDRKRIHLAL